ncbi:YopX family protein [Enterococcus gilvus]|uniref:YopX family protein n=1 Tax=Enterococcus gilvus TaxID=160453 RepID=UPI001C8CE478|nr:YopX family protein [Enterococcus gilvus]MBX8938496.1 DNA-packaging protein [Enterococcus gilvus]
MIPKFRAWDKRKQLMREVAVLDFNKNGNVSGIEYWKTPYDLQSIHANYINVMQSTGLKDKNGVEIFEGDVCEWHIPDMGRPEPDAMIRYVSVVEYRNGSFNLSGYLFPNVRLIKVIGNIYENPELLEVE